MKETIEQQIRMQLQKVSLAREAGFPCNLGLREADSFGTKNWSSSLSERRMYDVEWTLDLARGMTLGGRKLE